MAVYYPSDCDVEIPEHICDPCETFEKGKIRAIGFIKKTFEFIDPTNPTEWQAGINSHDIIIIPAVIGSFDGGSEVLGPGYGDQSESLLGYDFSASIRDPNYKSNCLFWNLLKNSRIYKFFYKTETQGHISDNPVTIIPKNPVTEDINSIVEWLATIKWKASDAPCPFDAPAGIFDQCFTVAP